MADSPPDNYADVDVTTLNYQQATEFRQELVHAILRRGTEYEVWDELADKKYRDKLAELDHYLSVSFGEAPGGNLP